jgi:hypothetical protein
MRSGGPYDGWWNGGIRNTAAFHNTIAILTEMIGSPTPTRIPLVMDRQLPTSDIAYPIAPQEWHFRQSIDYSISCNLAILDIASRMKENFLYNRYAMGKHSIERGSTDAWTPRPHRFAAVQAAVNGAGAPAGAAGGRGGRGGGNDDALWAALHKPEDRDPRAFVIPSNQPDFPTATAFVNALLETGIDVKRATREFAAQGKTYPAGSYVVFTAQAFRPHVMDMFEPQDHPDNFPVPGGPPQRPYDNAGWTLAYQMGVEFDRILDGFTGPFELITDWNVKPPAGRVGSTGVGGFRGSPGYAASVRQLSTFSAINRFLAAGIPVRRAGDAFIVSGEGAGRAAIEKAATDLGVNFVPDAPVGSATVSKRRIGLWDQYGGSIDAGWARWILEQFEFPFTRVFAPELDAGNLKAKYDTLIFVGGAIPGAGGRGGRGGGGGGGAPGGAALGPGDIPAQYRDQIGAVTVDKTLPQIKQFLEGGGTVIAIGTSATNLARFLNLPIENHLVENGQPLPETKFYAPGSVLRAHVDTTSAVAAGMKTDTDVFFDNSPVWTLGPDAAARGIKAVAWFDSKTPLRSGWAWGQAYLDQGVIAIDAPVGQGRLLMFGADILQRAQPYGTFKFLFNGIYLK